jgi:DNA-directed RNA polymerase subunit RPC12/RpoP
MVQAYCVKCRKKVEMKNPKQIKMKNGRDAVQGICPNCGIKVFRIGKL